MRSMKGRAWTYLFCSLILILTLPLIAKSPSAFAAKGPRMDNLLIKYYASVEAAYTALKQSEIDMVGYEITDVLYADAITDPNICLGRVADQGMYEFELNSNHTIESYPGVESFIFGKKRSEVRKAITYLVDKDLTVADCAGGFAERIDQLLAAPHKGWRNETHPGWGDGNFTYEYNPAAAVILLDGEGFVQGTTPNPAYNALLSWSAEFLRVYPGDHPTNATDDVHPIVMYIRTDDLRRRCAGYDLKYHLEIIGFTVSPRPGGIELMIYPPIIRDKDFHIFTAGWSLGRFPPLYQYGLMHSSQWYPWGSNRLTGVDENGLPNFPDLDDSLLEGYTATTYSAAQAAVKKSSGLAHYEYCVNIPLWSTASYWAWRCNVKGVVNAEGAGPENGYSFMNMYKTDGTTLVYGTKTHPQAMNKIYSSWYYDYQNLDRMELYGGLNWAPYDLSMDQTGFVTDWVVDSYIDFDTAAEQSKNTYSYRSDAYAVEPVTGNVAEHINATHVYANLWYTYQVPTSWNFASIQLIDHLNITLSDCAVEMYWATLSYWNTYFGGNAVLSFDWLRQAPISTSHTEDIAWGGGSGMDFVGLANPGVFWIERTVTLGGSPLVQGIDYEIYSPGSPTNIGGDADMRLIPATSAGTLHVEYLAVDDARGYTPGNIAWQTSFQGAGAFYATDFVSGAGGYLALAANRQYYMETPPLGEIDFVRKSNGAYRVDIFDVVIVASAYGSQGGGTYDGKWFPGADLVPDSCRVDIFDVVTVTGKYGQEWDYPPPCPPP